MNTKKLKKDNNNEELTLNNNKQVNFVCAPSENSVENFNNFVHRATNKLCSGNMHDYFTARHPFD